MNLYDTTNVIPIAKKYLFCGRCEDPNGNRERHADSCIMKMRAERKAKGHGLRPKEVSPVVADATIGTLSPSVYDKEQWTIVRYKTLSEFQFGARHQIITDYF